jgi:hypothetical protein
MNLYILVSVFLFGWLGTMWSFDGPLNCTLKVGWLALAIIGVKLLWNVPYSAFF